MELNTYVNFAGKCSEAFRFYEKHLGPTPWRAVGWPSDAR